MGKAYSMEFRRAVAKAYDECGSSTEVAEQFLCSASWVRRLVQRRRLTDSLDRLPERRADTRVLREPQLERLRELVAATPDLTLAELAAALAADGGAAAATPSVTTVWRAARALRLTLKKSRSGPPSRTGPTSRSAATPGSGSSPA